MKEVALIIIVLYTLSKADANGFSIDLIHRDSPMSPFYNSSMNETEVFTNAALRSIARANFFSDFINANNGSSKVESEIIQNQADYLMKIFIGNPPVEALVTADTGSTLIWVQCLPCENCYPQQDPIFDPKKSSTYELLPCSSDSCTLLPVSSCGTSEQCRYFYRYGDQSATIGDMGKEVISLGGSNGSMFVPTIKTIFGCGHENTGSYSSTGSGLVGLGRAPLSLVSQLDSQIGRIFSYCLVPRGNNATSKLTFGNQPTLTGKGVISTPFAPAPSKKPSSTFYYLSLEGISIDETRISVFQNVSNIIIDSGTTLMLLEQSFYNVVETAVAENIDDEAIRDPPPPYRMCYREATTSEMPDITLHFAGGADIRLPVTNMFRTFYDIHVTCLLMLPSRSGLNILGNMAQVNFKVEYDTVGGKLSFAPTDCTMQ